MHQEQKGESFILSQEGWILSPLYDVNPDIYGDNLSLNVNADDSSIDFDLAIDWLETAAEQKDPLACAQLAKVYDSWQHKNENKKIEWHKRAAEYGNADSMFYLGDYYAKKGENQEWEKNQIQKKYQ